MELKRWRQLPKKRITLNLDADVLAWFRDLGAGIPVGDQQGAAEGDG